MSSSSVKNTRATVRDQEQIRVRSSIAVSKKLEDFTNIDATDLNNGSVLVYKTNTDRWTSTLLLNQQNIDGGEF